MLKTEEATDNNDVKSLCEENQLLRAQNRRLREAFGRCMFSEVLFTSEDVRDMSQGHRLGKS